MKTDKHRGRKFVLLALAIVTSCEASNSAEGGQSAGPTQPALSGSCESDCEVPFLLQGGYLITVEARMGRQRRLRFALDTGATHSLVRPGFAKAPGSGQRPLRIVNLDRVITQAVLEDADFELGPVRIPQLLVLVNDLGYLRETAPDVDGVIGLDVLRMSSFGIDFGKRKIKFGAPRLLRSSVPIEAAESYLAVEVRMLDRPVRLLVDTGVPSILLYRDRMGDRLPDLKIEQRIRGASLGGTAPLEVVTLPRLELNGTELQRRAVLLRNSPAGFLPGVDGYLSVAALGAWRLSFDFERNLLSWE